ncbi:hypothetical protein ACTXG6_43515 [Pseudonocardia sp. Cha107L01]|uniref:hypothetical protein n=1 Tax=Pseudonocardia sp. Cha107L01 TaxID=3457576 RepID=UPI00403ECAD0
MSRRLDVEAITRRAAVATSTSGWSAVTGVRDTDQGVYLHLSDPGAAYRAARELRDAGYEVSAGPDSNRVSVTGWDREQLAERGDDVVYDIVCREVEYQTQAQRVLEIYRNQIARGADPESARVAVDQYLRQDADDRFELFVGETTEETELADGSVAVADIGEYGELPRESFLTAVSEREAAEVDRAPSSTSLDQTSEDVGAVAALEDAFEQLAARRYQIAEEAIARYEALSAAGAPRPHEQALDDLRDSIYADADQAVHARPIGNVLWAGREIRRRDALAARQGESAQLDASRADATERTEYELDDDREQCEDAVRGASITVGRLLEQSDVRERGLGDEIYDHLARMHEQDWLAEAADDVTSWDDGAGPDHGERL